MSAAASTIDPTLPPAEMTAALRGRLLQPLPGPASFRRMAPELAYGRHAGPPSLDTREAAVLVLLYPGSDGWRIPAMLRPSEMKFHAGQIALPGGLVEPGEAPYETALRELHEELGVTADEVQVLGALNPIFVFNSNFWVRPFLGVARQCPQFQPNACEVAEIIDIPLLALLDEALRGEHRIERRGLVFRAPHYQIGPHRVWGATSLILAELAALFRGE